MTHEPSSPQSEEVVRRLLAALEGLRETKPGPELEPTVRAYLEAQAVHVGPEHHRITCRRLARLLGNLRAAERAAGGRLQYVSDLRSTAVDSWMRSKLEAGAAPATIRQTVGGLKTALEWAVRRGLIESSPVKGVQLPSVGRAKQTRPRARPTADQVRALLDACSDADVAGFAPTHPGVRPWLVPQYPLLWILVRTGARRGELIRMIRDDYRREDGLLRIRAETAKTKRGRLIPLSPEDIGVLDSLVSVLSKNLPGLTGSDRLFLSPGGSHLEGRNITRWIHGLMRSAGVAKHNDRGETLCLHSLRHWAADSLARHNLFAGQALLGHASTKTTEGYLHEPDMEFLRRAMSQVPLPGPARGVSPDARPRSSGHGPDPSAGKSARTTPQSGVSEGNRTPDPQNHNLPVRAGHLPHKEPERKSALAGSRTTIEVPWLAKGVEVTIPTTEALLWIIRAQWELGDLLREGPLTLRGPRDE